MFYEESFRKASSFKLGDKKLFAECSFFELKNPSIYSKKANCISSKEENCVD